MDGSANRLFSATPHPLSALAALAFLAGIVLVQWLPHLPPATVAVALLLIGVIGVWRFPRLRLLALCVLGAAWVCLRADHALQQRLAPDLQGVDVEVTGDIVDLPDAREGSTRFDLRVRSATRDGMPVSIRGLLRLSWYGEVPLLAPCSQWQLRLRLKRPRGLSNPGGFDFERHALQQGIVATGYVRDEGNNRLIAAPGAICVDGWRESISAAIGQPGLLGPRANLLQALAVADQRGLGERDWQVLRATGVGHLIAISGFHVGLLAGFGVLLTRVLWKRFPRLVLRVPGPILEAPLGLVCATAYTALAGFALPTTRTLLMIAVVAFARLWRRNVPPAQALALALFAILILDPLAVLSAGFWLSFVGVAWLVFCLGGLGDTRWWRELLAAQGIMSLGLLPLTVWFFGQSSLIGPLANLIAVPWISLVVVPFTLAGSLLILPVPLVGEGLLQVAAACMDWQWWLLERLATLPLAQWYFPEPNLLAFVLALLGALWLLLPRGLPARWLGLPMLLPLLWPVSTRPPQAGFDVSVIDVGQGLAVLVTTAHHALLYDAGARFPSGFDLGEAVVVPAAHALGVRRLDSLVVSHGDNDHAGGAASTAAILHPARIVASEPARAPAGAVPCRAGDSWNWDGVGFRILHPTDTDSWTNDNDRSCVVLVEAVQGRLLLSGDISTTAEARIAAADLGGDSPLLLLVPHHGSKTSSGDDFLDAIRPYLAVVSAGHRSRFGHPHPAVVERYAKKNIPLLNTAESGCVRFRFRQDRAPEVIEQCRHRRARYWSEP